MPIPIYNIKNLFISKGNKDILSVKQFEIHRGACYVFDGRMGSGKTTLLRTLYDRKIGAKSEIVYEQKDIKKYSNKEYYDQIAVVPQDFKPPWGTVENFIIKTVRKFSYIKNPEKRLNDITRKMHLSDLLYRKMKSLSPGELRWVVLAAMIGADSKVLFIDEIEMHLSKKDLSNLISILHRKINYDGITLVTSTQNKDLISRISSVIVTLENGRIISVRSTAKKKQRYYNKK